MWEMYNLFLHQIFIINLNKILYNIYIKINYFILQA